MLFQYLKAAAGETLTWMGGWEDLPFLELKKQDLDRVFLLLTKYLTGSLKWDTVEYSEQYHEIWHNNCTEIEDVEELYRLGN